jgi:hypothetical protein
VRPAARRSGIFANVRLHRGVEFSNAGIEETARAAKVLSAGAFTLAASIRQPAVQRLVDNLWRRMTGVPAPGSSHRGR